MRGAAIAAGSGGEFLRKAALWGAAMLAVYAVAAIAVFAMSGRVSEMLSSIRWWMLPAFMAMALTGLALRMVRWFVLSAPLRGRVPARSLAAVYVGGFLMNLTPGRVGELWRAWALRQLWRVGYDRGLTLVFCERFMDLCILLVFAMLGFGLGGPFPWLATVAAGMLALAAFVAVLPRRAVALVKFAWGRLDKPSPRLFAGAQSMCRNVGAALGPSRFLLLLLLSALAWSPEAVALWYFAGELGHPVPPLAGAASLGNANIAGALTYLPGGIGGQEASLSFLLSQAGMPVAAAAVLVALMRVSTLWFSALLGLPFFVALTKSAGRSGR